MSQENVELVERAVAAINARDIDAYLACCTESIELWTPVAAIAGVYEGAAGIRSFFADLRDTGPDFRLTIERVEAIGDGLCVMAFLRISASGRASGIPQAADTANLYDLVNGKIRRVRIFLNRQEALEAVGLRE